MTQRSKKERERLFAEAAAEQMGATWTLGPDREHPDFIVTESVQHFGLEVCEVFSGGRIGGGSVMRRMESETQEAVNALRREYEATTNIALVVKFVGNMGAANMAAVVPALVARDLSSKPIGHHHVIDGDNGLRVHVTRLFVPIGLA